MALYLVADPVEATLLNEIRPDARSLYDYYEHGVHRQKIYERITEAMLAEVRRGQTVCAAFYGHAGIFVYLSHEAVRRARDEGYRARMLPPCRPRTACSRTSEWIQEQRAVRATKRRTF